MRKLVFLLVFQFTLNWASNAQICGDNDFPVPDDYLRSFYKELNINDVYSFDKAWFKNKQLNATLIIQIFTDLNRTAYYLFDSNFIDSTIIKCIELHIKTGVSTFDYIRDENKHLQAFKMFVDSAKEIDKKYFVSNKGIYLGMNKSEVLIRYNNSQKTKMLNGVEVYKWDCIYPKPTGAYDTIVEESLPADFGIHVTMYFRLNKLIALMINFDSLG
jgi:hypothetical protein